jgi:predicted PurR-regulated permease PerM
MLASMLDKLSPAKVRSPHAADPIDRSFTRRLLLVVIVVVSLVVAWRLSDVLVLAFGAILLALVLRGLAQALARATGLREAWAVAPVVVLLLAALATAIWLLGSQVTRQFALLVRDMPQGVAQLVSDINELPLGAWLLDQAQGLDFAGAGTQVAARISVVFASALRTVAYGAVLIVAAIYLAAQPERYHRGFLGLIPPARRDRYAEVLDLAGQTLRRWVAGQSLAMLAVGLLTGIGLWALGINAPLALGLIAGAFAFVPYVGPILAAAPGILVAASLGPMPAVYVLLLYAGVHFIEGNLVTPLVQAEAVELPPVMTIFAALVFTILLGPAGVLLAAPLMVVALVAVNMLYIEDVLGERRAWPSPHRGGDRG